jgi:BirA family transcriptional regulator, biotin operon repressor / biotin---[acetyl-CoA-carboxylase] ligase
MADSLDRNAVEPLLRGRFGTPYVYEPECDSTQHLVDSDAPEGTVAVCEFQTAGRGRLGRTWLAPRGTAIHCSLVLHPPPGRGPQELTLVGALAAAEAIDAATSFPTKIKWPNDVFLDEHKVAGVLGELHDGAVVLGIGINVNQTAEQLPADTRRRPGSLRTLAGQEFARAPLLASLLFELELRYAVWRKGGLGALHGEVERRDFLRGREVAIDGVRGRVVGIDESGRLMLEVGSERRLIESGEVEYG